jgi:hypothetical protein
MKISPATINRALKAHDRHFRNNQGNDNPDLKLMILHDKRATPLAKTLFYLIDSFNEGAADISTNELAAEANAPIPFVYMTLEKLLALGYLRKGLSEPSWNTYSLPEKISTEDAASYLGINPDEALDLLNNGYLKVKDNAIDPKSLLSVARFNVMERVLRRRALIEDTRHIASRVLEK